MRRKRASHRRRSVLDMDTKEFAGVRLPDSRMTRDAAELVRGILDVDGDGYVKVDSPSTRTTIEGVFACGDLVDHTYRQAITAAGSGCAAALDAERWLAVQEHLASAGNLSATA